jgi:putative salt-induced outer membrane protein YdiY
MTLPIRTRWLLLAAAIGTTFGPNLWSVHGEDAAPAAKPAAEAPKEEKKPSWVTTAALGVTLTRGNSKTLLATANILTEKKWDKNELHFGMDAAYGEDHDTKNTEQIHGFGQYNRLLTERLFAYMRVDALHDDIADLKYRVTVAPGIGYYFIKNEKTTLSGEFGPGFIAEEKGGDSREYFTLRVAERLEHKLNERVRVWEFVEYLPKVDDFADYIVNGEAGIDTAITKKLSLRVFAVDNYQSRPAKNRESNDFKLVAGIAYKF